MRTIRGLVTAILIVLISAVGAVPAAGAPEGQMTWAVHFALAPTWFDPAETSGIITPFVVLYALHDAMVKPLPGSRCRATRWARAWRSRGARLPTGSPTSSSSARASGFTTANR